MSRGQFEEQIADLKAEIAGLEDALAKTSADRDLRNTQLAATLAALTVSREEVDALTETLAFLEADLAALRTANTALNVQVADLREDLATARAK